MSGFKKTILSLVGKQFLSEARVAHVYAVSEKFRFIDLESEFFKTANWKSGDKIQINVGDWNMRTYTPISLNTEDGRLALLVYINGNGPGSQWASKIQEGDVCQFFGPSPSLKIKDTDNSILLFGDETAVAVAASLSRHHAYSKNIKFVFESDSPNEVNPLIESLGLKNAQVILKNANHNEDFLGQKILQMGEQMPACQFVLAGHTQSIQKVRNYLKSNQVSNHRIVVKSYWADGRTGLD